MWGLGLNVAYSQFMKKATSINISIIEMKNLIKCIKTKEHKNDNSETGKNQTGK